MSITKMIAQGAVDTWSAAISDVQVYRFDPQGAGLSGPAIVVFLPELDRREVDNGESELHAFDRTYRFPVSLYVRAGKPQSTQDRIAELMDLMVEAIDAVPTLGITDPNFRVEDSVLSDLEPQLYESNKGDPMIWELSGTLSVTGFVI